MQGHFVSVMYGTAAKYRMHVFVSETLYTVLYRRNSYSIDYSLFILYTKRSIGNLEKV